MKKVEVRVVDNREDYERRKQMYEAIKKVLNGADEFVEEMKTIIKRKY